MADEETQINPDIFNIDRNLLDEEWLNQPKLFFKYTEKLVKAEERLDEAERELKVIEAEADVRIREENEKTTEAFIKNQIMLDPVREAQVQIIAKRRLKVNLLKGVVQSLDQRKRALEKLVDLHGQQYFATPKASDRDNAIVEEIQNRAFIPKKKKEK